LSSSYTPPDASLHHSELAAAIAAAAQYDNAIQTIQAVVDRMVAERARLQVHIDGHHGLYSPVRRLPPEILCEIFMHFSEPPNRHMANSLHVLVKPDLSHVSRVCTKWRAIVTGAPKLW
ncbi:hypothetical protein FB45DRAFT_714023, partial [Roridomyces roridus]